MTAKPKNRALTPDELDAFAAELDALRARTVATIGQADADYIRAVHSAVRWFGFAGRALLMLAAIAGVMWASNYGTVQHAMGFMPGLKAFVAAVFGGIGNLGGAVLGGISLGLIESLGAGYLGPLTGGFLGSQYTDIFAFIVLALVLTLRPSGLLGERVADRA